MYVDEQGVDTEVAKMFALDSKEKKTIGRGIHNRASRKSGLRRPVSFAYEYMDKKQKKEYTKGGKVEVYSLLDKYVTIQDVPKDYTEFFKMDKQFATDLLTKIRGFATIQDLANHFRFRDKKDVYKKLLDKFDIPRREVHNKGKKGNKEVVNEIIVQAIPYQQVVQAVPEITSEGYTIKLKGTYDDSNMCKRIQNMLKMFVSDKEYKVNISITEIIEKDER